MTLKPASPESYMFHHPNIELTRLQAEAIGLPLILRETPARREEELNDLRKVLREAKAENHIEGVITGAIDSDYQKTRIDRIAEEMGLKSFAPLWRKNPMSLLEDQLISGFKAIICGVYAHGFDKSWLSRPIGEETIRTLANLQKRFGIHPSGEGGEYESLVLDAPFFKQRIKIDEASTDWAAGSETGSYNVLRAHLEPKRN